MVKGCVHCNPGTPDSVHAGNFELSWNDKGDITITLTTPQGVTLAQHESPRLKRLKEMFGKKEPEYPMMVVSATAFGAFDYCPICKREF
jgi:hypothetical protein